MKIEKREDYGRRGRNFHNTDQDMITDKQRSMDKLGYWDLEDDMSIYSQTDSHHPRFAKNPDEEEQIINQDDAITNDENQEEADQKLDDYYDEEENDIYEEEEEEDLFRDADLSENGKFRID
jgi:hypothetical protein